MMKPKELREKMLKTRDYKK